MFNPYETEQGDDEGTIFRDVIMLALAGFVVIVLLLIPHINPVSKQVEEEIEAPGNLIVEIIWPNELHDDIDLWVKGPDDRPVGYSNKAGRLFNLLRDDLGGTGDVTGLNYENAFTRGIVGGEYIINIHHYKSNSQVLPIEVRVVISIKKTPDDTVAQLLTRVVHLDSEGQELTVVRFELDDDGKLDQSSVHDTPRPLRGQSN